MFKIEDGLLSSQICIYILEGLQFRTSQRFVVAFKENFDERRTILGVSSSLISNSGRENKIFQNGIVDGSQSSGIGTLLSISARGTGRFSHHSTGCKDRYMGITERFFKKRNDLSERGLPLGEVGERNIYNKISTGTRLNLLDRVKKESDKMLLKVFF